MATQDSATKWATLAKKLVASKKLQKQNETAAEIVTFLRPRFEHFGFINLFGRGGDFGSKREEIVRSLVASGKVVVVARSARHGKDCVCVMTNKGGHDYCFKKDASLHLPLDVIGQRLRNFGEAPVCAICRESFDHSVIQYYGHCGHPYHLECLDGWQAHCWKTGAECVSCPVCRKKIADHTDGMEVMSRMKTVVQNDLII
ncbi:hypothetical protein WJX72_004412 [[Myrmecia] bisecta]|uniref:RING-type domain-containing protein n=1 Tax=[Myrmecia] bisecta TaxID=41462 RepID=A0AAW1P5I6_9CHLO